MINKFLTKFIMLNHFILEGAPVIPLFLFVYHFVVVADVHFTHLSVVVNVSFCFQWLHIAPGPSKSVHHDTPFDKIVFHFSPNLFFSFFDVLHMVSVPFWISCWFWCAFQFRCNSIRWILFCFRKSLNPIIIIDRSLKTYAVVYFYPSILFTIQFSWFSELSLLHNHNLWKP